MKQTIVDVFIENPAGTRNKYEFDKEADRFRLDRVLFASYNDQVCVDHVAIPPRPLQSGQVGRLITLTRTIKSLR